jgi:hypothetical protein
MKLNETFMYSEDYQYIMDKLDEVNKMIDLGEKLKFCSIQMDLLIGEQRKLKDKLIMILFRE